MLVRSVRHGSLASLGIDAAASVLPNDISCSAVISACGIGQHWQQDFGYFTQPCSVLVRSVSHGSLASLGIDAAASVLPNDISCSAVISACGIGQHWQQDLVTLTVMLQTAVLPSVISCSAVTAVINASEKGQQWHHALDLLASMQQTAVLPNVISYSAAVPPYIFLLNACEVGKQLQQALVSWRGCFRLLFCPISIPTMLPSVLVQGASNGSRPWVSLASVCLAVRLLAASLPNVIS